MGVLTQAAPKNLIIGSYNLHNLENIVGLQSDLSHLSFVDVWGFQEVMFEGTKPQNGFSQLLPSDIFHIVALPVSLIDSEQNLWEGHAIASRFPIEQAGLIFLEPALQQTRAALYAIINVNGTRLLFINTDHDIDHFKVGYFQRRKNVKSLIEGIDRLEFKGPKVVVGDFNTADSYANWIRGLSGQEEVRLTQRDFNALGWSIPNSNSPLHHTFSSYGITQQLDHIFIKDFRSFGSWYRYDTRIGSDHFPIFLEIQLPKNKRPFPL